MASIVHVIRPELTHEERERRMEEIKKAAIRFYIATEKNRRAAGIGEVVR